MVTICHNHPIHPGTGGGLASSRGLLAGSHRDLDPHGSIHMSFLRDYAKACLDPTLFIKIIIFGACINSILLRY